MKICCTCKEEKSLDCFGKNRSRPDGLTANCKSCKRSSSKQSYARLDNTIKKNKRREYYLNNKETELLRNKKWKESRLDYYKSKEKERYIKNKDTIAKKRRDLYIENPEYFNNKNKKSYIKNKHDGRYTRKTAKRRSMKLKATPEWSESDKIKLVYKKAKELSELLGCDMEVDHYIPLNNPNVCGLHVWSNLQILEKEPNRQKSNKLLHKEY